MTAIKLRPKNYKGLLAGFDNYQEYRDSLLEELSKKAEQIAKEKDKTAWEIAQSQGTKAAYAHYLHLFQKGLYYQQADTEIKKIIDEELEILRKRGIANDKRYWSRVCKEDSQDYYQRYLNKYPDGLFYNKAISRLDTIKKNKRKQRKEEDYRAWKQANNIGSKIAFEQYINNFPQGDYVSEVNVILAEIYSQEEKVYLEEKKWKEAKALDTEYAYFQYREEYPNGKYFSECDLKYKRKYKEVTKGLKKLKKWLKKYHAYDKDKDIRDITQINLSHSLRLFRIPDSIMDQQFPLS
jgi:hypothetical protein